MKSSLRILLVGFIALTMSANGLAQLTIGSTTEFVTSSSTVLTTNNAIRNSSNRFNFQGTIELTGANQLLTSSVPVTVGGLALAGSGNKSLEGEWTITRTLQFRQGILAPSFAAVNGGKIVYTGTETLSGTPSSYVNGTLYQRGTDIRFFPVGEGSTYLPMSFTNVIDGAVELGVRAFNSGVSLTLPLDVAEVANNRHWRVSTSGGEFRGSPVSLYVPRSSVDGSGQLVAVHADDTPDANAINLGGGIIGDFVSSFLPANKPILTIGIGERVDLRIFDLITPFNADNINDQLHILNIEYTASNKVTLLDRWGVPVKTWNNFRNYDDPVEPNQDNFDFTRLSPGNYICVLEYQLTPDSPTEKVTQMITVLK
ncbi:MAG: hypothetical protein KF687_05795 [Cyclobacteriaceae bacterium]|nr:hypothetical protein [Cyclobacteriaceae bacterium]